MVRSPSVKSDRSRPSTRATTCDFTCDAEIVRDAHLRRNALACANSALISLPGEFNLIRVIRLRSIRLAD